MKKMTVVIVGGGSSGWMTAAALARFLPRQQYELIQIESAVIGTVGVGEATIPHIRQFNQMLGIDENEFIRATGATYKLAIQFDGWGAPDSRYMHPFGFSGHDINGINFHQYWLHLNRFSQVLPFDHFSVAAMAASQDKFQYQHPDPDCLLAEYNYAFHLDASLYADYLKAYAVKLGVKAIEGKVANVCLASDSGNIDAVVLESAQRIEGDLFVDCSGFRGVLIEQALKTGYQSWSHWLPCDRALAVPSEKMVNPPSYTRATAKKVGWQWRIPLQHRTGNGLVYCGQYLSDDEAQQILLDGLDRAISGEPKLLRFSTGKRKRSWHKNCVAIGLSAAFLEPLESTSLYLTQIAIQKLIEFFPANGIRDIERDTFNQQLDNEYGRVRDFIILHYKINQRDDSDFWRDCRAMSVPDSLQQQMELFARSGHTISYRQGLFVSPSWLAVYLGQGWLPERYDPRASHCPIDKLQAYFEQYAEKVKQAVSGIQSHVVAIEQTQRADFSAYPPVQFNLYGRRL